MIVLVVPCGIVAGVVLIWLAFRSDGYKRDPLEAPPGPDWERTGERFTDPQSGETLDVWYRPRNGERAYVRVRSRQNRY